MSGMFDKKTEKEKRKQELTQKQQKERNKRRIITIAVTAVFLLAFAAAVIVNSAWIRRTVPVVTIDGMEFNTAEFEYFFNNEYLRISSELSSQGMGSLLPDPNRSFDKQVYNASTGETWADVIMTSTLDRMTDTVAVYKAAVAAGFTISEEGLAQIDASVQSSAGDAEQYGYPTVDSYLQRIYGSGMNEQIYREMLTLGYVADEYIVHYRESFNYSSDELAGFYAEKADILDVFTFRVFLVEMEEPEEVDDDLEAALEISKTAARETAEAYFEGIETEEDLIAAALDYNEEYYPQPEYTFAETRGVNVTDYNSIDFYFADWLLGDRQYGDKELIDTHQGTAILFFISRDDNSYKTLSMRQILLKRESVSPFDYPEGEDDPDYKAALEHSALELQERADLVNKLFTDNGASEQALIDLMADYSEDTTEGGYYENIAKFPFQGADYSAFRLVPEIEQWLFDESRVVDDWELIETEAFGFHLVYFTGAGEVFANAIADDLKRVEDTGAWIENLPRAEPVKLSRHSVIHALNRRGQQTGKT